MNEPREPDLPRTAPCRGGVRRMAAWRARPAPCPGHIVGSRSWSAAGEFAEISTRVLSGKPASVARVGEATIARSVYELWDNAGALLACVEAFHEQGARGIRRRARVERGGAASVRVAPVEFTGLVRAGASSGWGEEVGDARHG